MRGVAVGIDIGTSAITTAVLHRGAEGVMRIAGIGRAPSAGVRHGVVADTEEVTRALRASIAEVRRASGMPIRSAVVSVGGTHLSAFASRGVVAASHADGEITADDVRRAERVAEGFARRNPNRELLHLIPQFYKVDSEDGVADPVGMVGMKLEAQMLAVDAAKPALANLLKCCEASGVEVDDWVCGILAASEVALTKQHKELGTMLLDLGGGTSDFAVFEEGRIMDIGSFPIGGGRITADIALGLRASVAVAEAVKLRYGSVTFPDRSNRRETITLAEFASEDETTVAARDLVEMITARLSDIFELTTKALRKVGRLGLLPGGVVIIGGVARLPDIGNLARRELKLPIEVPETFAPEELEEAIPPELAVAVGLALWQARRREGASWWAGSAVAEAWEEAKRMLRSLVP